MTTPGPTAVRDAVKEPPGDTREVGELGAHSDRGGEPGRSKGRPASCQSRANSRSAASQQALLKVRGEAETVLSRKFLFMHSRLHIYFSTHMCVYTLGAHQGKL